MGFLSWLGGVILLFWLIGLIFSIGGAFIHILIIVAVVVFLSDLIRNKKR